MITLQELGKGAGAWRRSQMTIKNEVCPNSSTEPVHCNMTTKYLNMYTETFKRLNAFLPPFAKRNDKYQLFSR